MSNALTVADVLERGVAVEWHEGVALVREVADLLDGAGPPYAIPDLHDIQISRDGHVGLLGGIAVDEPVRRLGQLLQAVLSESEAPVQLRLVISQATAPGPSYESILAYRETLAYFERPGRQDVLRRLYERAAAVAVVLPRALTPTIPTLDTRAPLSHSHSQVETSAPPSTGRVAWRRRRLALVGVAVVVLACLAGAQYFRRQGAPRLERRAATLAQSTSTRVGSTLLSGLSAVTDRVGLGRIVLASKVEAQIPPVRLPVQAKTQRRRPGPTVPKLTQITPLVFDLEQPSEPLETAVTATPSATITARPIDFSPAAQMDLRIYSRESEGVAPPVGVRPQLPQALPIELDPDTLGRIELIILPDGTVESVKLLGNRPTVYDGMMLSAAKAWLFQPALKDGRPVKYRKTVWMALP